MCAGRRQAGGRPGEQPLLSEQQLVALLTEVVPQGQANAKVLTAADYAAFEVRPAVALPRPRCKAIGRPATRHVHAPCC